MTKINYVLLFLIISTTACQFGKSKDVKDGDNNIPPVSLVVNDKAETRIDSTLKSVVQSGKIAGVSALIYENDKEVY
ncbi:hypothetical protein RM545_13845 [Zunongwangia sp. F260]|uniref:Uncharacterized protein n=1 Tax=Autumnicola lenta TaxID=3075593 RepID=A0ABU3CN43_9FLAO|nr:hypothetical protein [Zunongwangia sp. F260]MDT0647778.1 hypothetical protein [Zunongwangia sp. F260]